MTNLEWVVGLDWQRYGFSAKRVTDSQHRAVPMLGVIIRSKAGIRVVAISTNR